MKKSQNNLTDAEILRQKAEKQLKKQQSKVSSLSSENDLRKLTHELQVHQIELEMQYEQLKKTKEESDAATQKYTELYDFAPSGNFTLTKLGEIIGLNLHGASLLGKERLHLINERFGSSVSDQTKPIFNHFFNKVFTSKGNQSCEVTLSVESKNIPTYVYLTGHALENGEQCLISIVDITQRKLAEEALQESEERFRKIFEESQVGIIISTQGYRFEKTNPAFCSMMDYTTNELISMTFLDITHPDDIGMDIENIKKLELGEIPFYVAEKRYLRKTGEIRWGNIIISCIRNKDGTQLYYLGMIHDITERKQAEEALSQSEENFRRSISESPLGIRIVSVDGKTIYANKAFLDIYKINSVEEFTSIPAINRYTPESYTQHQERKEKRNNGHDVFDYEISILCANAGIRHIKIWRREVLWNGTKHYQIINLDITEQKKLTTDLIAAKEQAEESDRLKSAFLTNMSHEIRTPMNGILGFAELLKEPNLSSDDLKDYIQTIEISGARMLNTINSIVDVSKIESGLIQVDIKETDINEKIEFTYKFFKPEVEIKGLQFLFKNGLPTNAAIIKTDNEKVYGILTNLVRNAIKFTFDGSIEFGYEKKGEYLEFFVKDTGVGIPQNQHKIIFERFRQGSESHNRGYEGSGLGLSISKSYVEMLGGRIWVESEEGLGSTFYFTIPYIAVSEEKNTTENIVSAEHKEVQVKKLRILIVEDDEISYSFLTRTLQKISKEVLHAITGVQAVEACRNNPDLDLVLMDIRMPVMDGNEATRKIRKFNKDVIIIAQTAYGFSGDREKAIEAGCNDYISKPINSTYLFELIRKHINK